MVDNEVDVAGFNSLTELKKAVQQDKIKQRIYAEYAKTPIGKEPNRKKLAKLIGVSENTISMAFEETARPKESSDFNKTITKALGIATPMLLLQEENISKISNFLNEHEEIAALGGGVYLLWNQFVKPRIDDPKNELSELEVVIELFKSSTGQAFVAGIFGLIAGNRLLETIEKAGGGIGQAFNNLAGAIQNGLINFGSNIEDEIEEARELFGLDCIICVTTGEKFESYALWFIGQDAGDIAANVFNPVMSFFNYYSEKKKFIDACGPQNIMLCSDYEDRIPATNGQPIPEEGGTGPEIPVPEEIATAPGEDDTLSTLPPPVVEVPVVEVPTEIGGAPGEDTEPEEEGDGGTGIPDIELGPPGGGQVGDPGDVSDVGGGGPRRLVSPGQEDIVVGPSDLY